MEKRGQTGRYMSGVRRCGYLVLLLVGTWEVAGETGNLTTPWIS